MARRNPGRDKSRKRAATAAVRLPWPRLAILVAAGILAALATVWTCRRPSVPIETIEEDASEETFSEAAFSPNATVEDLKQAAVAVVHELVEAFPDRPEPLNVLGWLENNLGNSAEAIRCWERCVALDPQFVDPLLSMATVARQTGEQERAGDLLRRARTLAPREDQILALLAEVLLSQGQAAEAIGLLEARLKEGDTPFAILSPLGHAYLQAQRYAEARDVLERAVESSRDQKNAWYALARASERLGDRARAKECQARFRELTAQDHKSNTGRIRAMDDLADTRRIATDAHCEAAKVYLKHGRWAKAESLWRRAAALDPRNAECRIALASLYERTGRPGEALRSCRQLCEIQPERSDYWLFLAILSARSGRMEEARAAARNAVERDPDNPKCREVDEAIRNADVPRS